MIDPSTDTMYFFTKGYFNGLAGPQGTLQGVYKLWALIIPTLAVVSGFPVEIGGLSDNDLMAMEVSPGEHNLPFSKPLYIADFAA